MLAIVCSTTAARPLKFTARKVSDGLTRSHDGAGGRCVPGNALRVPEPRLWSCLPPRKTWAVTESQVRKSVAIQEHAASSAERQRGWLSCRQGRPNCYNDCKHQGHVQHTWPMHVSHPQLGVEFLKCFAFDASMARILPEPNGLHKYQNAQYAPAGLSERLFECGKVTGCPRDALR